MGLHANSGSSAIAPVVAMVMVAAVATAIGLVMVRIVVIVIVTEVTVAIATTDNCDTCQLLLAQVKCSCLLATGSESLQFRVWGVRV